MSTLIITNHPNLIQSDWEAVQIISPYDYLTKDEYAQTKNLRIFNLCSNYQYQSNGYYVSLLAAARGHKPIPNIATIQNMKSSVIQKLMTEDLDDLVQKSLKDLHSTEFVLSIYFGKNIAKKYDRLSWKLFSLFESPLIKANFVFKKQWILKKISPVSIKDIPQEHHEFLMDQIKSYLSRKSYRRLTQKGYRYDLAILNDPNDPSHPSDEKAIKKFIKAAESLDIQTEIINRDDFIRIAEFDALFIRNTTQVNNYTFQFARKAEAERLAVIDNSESIIRCTNKVYLAEVLFRNKIPMPKTWIVHKGNIHLFENQITFPCVVKLPDSSFSLGVIKAKNWPDLMIQSQPFFTKSEMIIIQEFIQTDYDWRIGIIDHKPIFACKYYMAPKHWQIINNQNKRNNKEGIVDTFTIEDVPPKVIQTALKSAQLFGNSLYGVDIKIIDNKPIVIEVNDNPSIESGFEDKIEQQNLYQTILNSFITRIEAIKKGSFF